jgi:hypothetical protein
MFSPEQFVQFTDIHFHGDPFLRWTVWIDPSLLALSFKRCYLQNTILALSSTGRLYFDTCVIDTLHDGGFLNNTQPNNTLHWDFVNCSVISTYRGEPTSRSILSLVNTYWRSNSSIDGALYLRGSADVIVAESLIDGRSRTRRGIVIDDIFQGTFYIYRSKIIDSSADGIESKVIWNGSILLEEADISFCAAAGVNAVGPISVASISATSATPNQTFGIVLRNGAKLQDNGGNTLTGTTNDLDLGAGSQIAWGALPHTNTTELTRGA